MVPKGRRSLNLFVRWHALAMPSQSPFSRRLLRAGAIGVGGALLLWAADSLKKQDSPSPVLKGAVLLLIAFAFMATDFAGWELVSLADRAADRVSSPVAKSVARIVAYFALAGAFVGVLIVVSWLFGLN